MKGHVDFSTYDRVVKQNVIDTRLDMESAEASYRQKVAAHNQALRAEETWEKTKDEFLDRLEERQNGLAGAN